ncbi:MAG: hypothetical protein PVF08_10415 [Gammaproteobacteria bacterium]|jgi:hypothetical protein
MNLPCGLLLLAGCLAPAAGLALEKPYAGPFVENEDMLFVLIPRTPDQMAAFYEARGFPPAAIGKIRATCFVTAHIENHSQRIIWLEPHTWKFSSKGQPLQRLDRNYWETQWDAIGLRQANRSTFGWTQLPAERDLQPDEPVGGNVVFPGTAGSFTIEAYFPTGKDRRGKPIAVRFENVSCPTVKPAE